MSENKQYLLFKNRVKYKICYVKQKQFTVHDCDVQFVLIAACTCSFYSC